jgi:uncharacterized protein YhaN
LQELEGRARARYDRLARLSSELDRYRGQYDALDALVEALRTDNGWLEYRLRVVQDALLDQRAQTTKDASAVDRVKAALLERDEALAVVNGDLHKARYALAEAQTCSGGEGGGPHHGADPTSTGLRHPRGGTVVAGPGRAEGQAG